MAVMDRTLDEQASVFLHPARILKLFRCKNVPGSGNGLLSPDPARDASVRRGWLARGATVGSANTDHRPPSFEFIVMAFGAIATKSTGGGTQSRFRRNRLSA